MFTDFNYLFNMNENYLLICLFCNIVNFIVDRFVLISLKFIVYLSFIRGSIQKTLNLCFEDQCVSYQRI